MSVLLLNASYEPLAVVSWKRAIGLVFTGRAEMVEQDGDRVVRSAGGLEFPRPNVVRLVRMVSFASMRVRRQPGFSKPGLVARDQSGCQVSGCDRRGDTIDHIVPKSTGGETTWENCVLMCARHNSAKASRSLADLGWTLKRPPRRPSAVLIIAAVEHRPEWGGWLSPAV
ncbi:HNH endonuclease [Acidimicrobiaceae bacterium AH-315-P05]|nr:HNH endonuclease [Acidimicrobiaceae bacterium AH-315-P05]